MADEDHANRKMYDSFDAYVFMPIVILYALKIENLRRFYRFPFWVRDGSFLTFIRNTDRCGFRNSVIGEVDSQGIPRGHSESCCSAGSSTGQSYVGYLRQV